MASKLSQLFAADNLPSWFPLHHYNTPKYNYSTSGKLIDPNQISLWISLGTVLFNPIFWNLVARNEYRNKTLTKTLGSPYLGCYVLAVAIFSLGIFRDIMYEQALRSQPHLAVLGAPAWKAVAYGLIGLGQVFVITSIYALGITGTYLGDYFGILMKSRVTGFPFNVLNDPMYVGSTMAFLGSAILYQCPAGIAMTGLVWIVYAIALKFEGPFTDKIYSSAHKKSSPAQVQTTPTRKSSRIAKKQSAEGISSSYAEAAKHAPAGNGLPSTTPSKITPPVPAVTPRTTSKRRVASDDASGASTAMTPGRMTRSRSKGRVESETE